jgi:hypothetical protein
MKKKHSIQLNNHSGSKKNVQFMWIFGQEHTQQIICDSGNNRRKTLQFSDVKELNIEYVTQAASIFNKLECLLSTHLY